MTEILNTEVAVIGAGTAGLTAFHEVRRAGRDALLIDHGPLGTTCARVGCMPSKAVLHAAHKWSILRELAGAQPAVASVTADDLWRQALAMRDTLAEGAAKRTRHGAGERLLMGTARFVGPGELGVGGRRVRASAVVVATGSRPAVPDFLLALGDCVLTTDTLFDREKLPRSIGIIGAGAVGLEMAVALSRLGVRVVAADLRSAPGGIADPAIAERAAHRFRDDFTLWLGERVQVLAGPSGAEIRRGGEAELVEVVLAAIGRQPNLEALDLSKAGATPDAKGRFAADQATLRLPGTSVFFAGDVHPDRALMHEAADEGLIAARGALAVLEDRPIRPKARRTPLGIVFTDPDICSVGRPFDRLDPESTVIGTAEGAGNGRSRILHAESSLVRVYARRDDGLLLGASLIAEHGEHLAHQIAWAVQRGETVRSLLEMPYYHPAVEEMLQSALKDAVRQIESVSEV
jgi:dihydrolipoamide dehydrogenase